MMEIERKFAENSNNLNMNNSSKIIRAKYQAYIKASKTEINLLVFVIVCFVVTIWLAGWFGYAKKEFGEIGDVIGGILNPVVSLAALIALLISIKQSRAALNLSTEELYETKKELEKSRISHEEISKLNNKSYQLQKLNSEIDFILRTLERSKKSIEDLVRDRPFSDSTNFHAIIYSSDYKERIKKRFSKKNCRKTGEHLFMQTYGRKVQTYLSILIMLIRLDNKNPAILYFFSDISSELGQYITYCESHAEVKRECLDKDEDEQLGEVCSKKTFKKLKEFKDVISEEYDVENEGG